MFERFTNTSRRAMVLANEEARERDHNFIGVQHLALGLRRMDEEAAGGLFQKLVSDLAAFDAALDAEAASGESGTWGSVRGKPPFTPRAKKALELALREAVTREQNWIGPGHIVLGLIGAGGPQALLDHVDRDRAGLTVADWESDQPQPRDSRDSDVARGFQEVLQTVMNGEKPVTTTHLLRALIKVPNTMAAQILAALGVTRDKVDEVAASIPIARTLDAPPEKEYEVRVGEHSIRVDDAKSRDLLRGILDDDPELAEQIRAAIDRKAKEGD